MKRIRIRRTSPVAGALLGPVDKFAPKWKPYTSIVRLVDDEGAHYPEVFVVVGVETDEYASTSNAALAGNAHRYRLKSLVTGEVSEFFQGGLEEITPEYAEYVLAFYLGATAKLRALIRKTAQKVEKVAVARPRPVPYDRAVADDPEEENESARADAFEEGDEEEATVAYGEDDDDVPAVTRPIRRRVSQDRNGEIVEEWDGPTHNPVGRRR